MNTIAIWAQHTAMSGTRVFDHDDECTSDDHIHLSFKSKQEALQHAETVGNYTGADGGFHARYAAAVRVDAGFMD